MRIKLLIIALLLFGAVTPASAQKTKSVLGSEITSQFPSNTTGAITPLILRNVTNDFLNSWQQFPAVNAQTGTTYVFLAGDYGSLTTFNNTNPVAVTLPTPGGSFGIGWNVFVRTIGAGTATLTPVGATINGLASVTVTTGQSIWIVSDGNNYQVWNNSSGTLTSFNMSVPGSIFSISGIPCTTTCSVSMTTAGTSGGLPFFDSATTLASTAVQAANGVIFGGGAGLAPSSTAAGATGTLLRGGTPPAFTATPTLGTAGTIAGTLALASGGGGATTLSPSAAGNVNIGFPLTADTLVGKATTDALTNKTYNGLTVTTSTGTLTVTNGKTLGATNSITLGGTDGKTLSVSNSLTLQGTDATTHIFPALSSSVAALNLADQTLQGGANVVSLAQSTGSIVMDCGARPLQTISNNGGFTITAPALDGSCIIKTTNTGSAGTITFSGFSVGSNTGDSLSTTNGLKFMIFVYRVGGDSTYSVKALQ